MTMMKENEQEMQHGHDEMPIAMDARDGGAGAWGVIAHIGNAIQKKMEISPQSVTAHECAIMNACNRALAERPQTVLSRMETLGRLKEELEFCENNLKRDVGLSPFGLARHCEVLREIVVALEAHEEGGEK